MYEKYYSFREKPFRLTPDPEFLYLSKQHQGALDHMTYGISQQEGFMAIVGDVGTGKTTLCRRLLEQMDPKIAVALVLNPMLSDMDLLRTCVHDLGVPRLQSTGMLAGVGSTGDTVEAGGDSDTILEVDESPADNWVNTASKKELIDVLNHFLIAQHKKGGATVLIIDEAQNLPLDVLEQLRILSNLETEKDKLLQIIFVGQLELYHKLRLPELKQLNQRISIRYEVTPLSHEETRKYVNHRLKVAGVGSKVAFSSAAIQRIYQFSKGYPRLINLACDRTLLAGYNGQTDYLEGEHARKGIESLGLQDSPESRIQSGKSVWSKLSFMSPVLALMLAWLGYEFLNANFLEPEAFKPIHTHALPVSLESRKNLANSVNLQNNKGSSFKEPVLAGNAEITAGAEELQDQEVLSQVGYRIHLGEFSSAAEAQLEVEALKELGFQIYLNTSDTGVVHNVYIGPYADEKSANIHVQALKYSGRTPVLLSIEDKG